MNKVISKDFLTGFKYPFLSIQYFIKYPKLILLSIIPILLNLIIYVFIFVFVFLKLINASEKITGVNNGEVIWFMIILHYIILILAFILLILITYYLFLILGGIVSAPFNEKLSRYIEEKITNERIIYDVGFFKDAYISIKAELEKILFYIIIMTPIFLLNFIPLIGSIFSSILGIGFSIYYNSLDFYDYPMTRYFYNFGRKLSTTNKKLSLSIGFGTAGFILMIIPFLNVFFRPLLVVSGTAIFFEKKYNLQ